MPGPAINVFISYAHGDAPFFEVFKKGVRSHLSNSGIFSFNTWEDSEIPLGSQWDQEIQSNLGGSQLAILCVSSNFLNSRYIRSDEYQALVNKYPGTLIIPVYFNHCHFGTWEDLAEKQFFKPSGDRYDEETQEDFAFCDMVRFNRDNGAVIANSNIDLYCRNFVTAVEKSLSKKYNLSVPFVAAGPEIIIAADISKPAKKLTDKIVEGVIIAAIVLSLVFVFYTLVINNVDFNTKKFNGTIGCTMFFGSFASFVFNRKYITAKS